MPVKPIYPDVVIPDEDLWTYQFEQKSKPFAEDREIYIDPDTGRSYTWAQTKATALEFGKGLRAQWGFQKGDVLGFFSNNTIDFAPAFFGVLWCGGAAMTANPAYTATELAFQLKDSGSKGIVTQVPFLPIATAAAKEAGIPQDRIILMGDGRDERFRHFTSIRDTKSQPGAPAQRARLDPKKDLAFLVYSSGTTGLPKGVMLTHTNIVANLVQLLDMDYKYNGLHHTGEPDGKGDKQLAILPFFHIYGLTCIALQGLKMGLQVVVMPKFDLERACQIIQKHQITYICIPPPIVLGLAKHPIVDKYDLSSVKWLNSGAAPLGKDLVEIVWQRLKIPVMQGYGLSETSPTLTKGVVADWAKYNGSCGKLLPNILAKIVDLDGNELPENEEGELWVSGPNIFPGYLNRPELTADTFSEDGYFRTGDIGYYDSKGNFFITDRLKELIKYKGFQVPPAELEAKLLGHPEIDDACVIPAHDRERETEVPRAYIVLKKGIAKSDGKAGEIVKWLDSKVAEHKKLRGGVRFVDEVPKNASGKLLRRVLKEQARKEDRAAEGAKL
ncbi:hypothetical protein Micbo1qcDRAFT_143614 [Microdochium bolleyi]|uniref:4-coumarate-CoA ligase n=1 Tax=Microdochium bolleyi TaxID=196109 RepID=A0A136JDY7_9PEZI|nr:hypothetical protein Micbo1qcDRAFT_143614 [Microdochium bolleyi]